MNDYLYAAGSLDATRRIESSPSDARVYIRGHRAGIFAAATAAADAEPTRGTEGGVRERSDGARNADAVRTAAQNIEIGWTRTRISAEAVLVREMRFRCSFLRVEGGRR